MQTNQYIEIKNVTILADKSLFYNEYKINDSNNLQINVRRLTLINETQENNFTLKKNYENLKSIEIIIEFSIINKTINENLDESQQLNGLIKWNLELNLPKYSYLQRNYSLDTTLLLQKTNLIKILPIIEVSRNTNFS